MKDRLLQLLGKLNISATKLADEINVQRSGISHILSGRNQPSFDFLVKILTRYPEIDPEWLILGKGTILRNHKKQEESVIQSENKAAYGNSERELNLFSQGTDKDSTASLQKETPQKITNVTPVTRIILLYSDGGYEIFDQPKNS